MELFIVFVVLLVLSVYFYLCLNTKSKLAIDGDVLEYQFTMQIVFTDSNNIQTYLKMHVE